MEGLYLDLKWIGLQFHVYSIVLGIGSLDQTYCNFGNIGSTFNGIFSSLHSEIRSILLYPATLLVNSTRLAQC